MLGARDLNMQYFIWYCRCFWRWWWGHVGPSLHDVVSVRLLTIQLEKEIIMRMSPIIAQGPLRMLASIALHRGYCICLRHVHCIGTICVGNAYAWGPKTHYLSGGYILHPWSCGGPFELELRDPFGDAMWEIWWLKMGSGRLDSGFERLKHYHKRRFSM